jgi:hypothetical protein
MLNGMILFNVVVKFVETVYDKATVAVKAIKDSYASDILIFRNRNESPWPSKESPLPVLKGSHLFYSVNAKKFYYVEDESEVSKMDDIIVAQLVDKSGLDVCDMSEFFHLVKWPSYGPPSIYELVLVQTLLSGLCLSKEFLSTCVLNVTTLEYSFSVKLNNPLVKDDFISWSVFAPLGFEEDSTDTPVDSAVASPVDAAPVDADAEAPVADAEAPLAADASVEAAVAADAADAEAPVAAPAPLETSEAADAVACTPVSNQLGDSLFIN